MAFELKEGQGTLFKNNKEGNDARPDFRGEAKINGETYRIAGWVKQGKNGKWISLKIDTPTPPETRDALGKRVDIDSDVPW